MHQESELSKSSVTAVRTFPQSPFSHFLLLTADGTLKRFIEEGKVLNSQFYYLFNHLDRFLHPALQIIKFDPAYFFQTEDEPQEMPHLLDSIFEGVFPSDMKSTQVNKASDIVSREKLLKFWKCFEEDQVFSKCLPVLLKHWTLLLTTDNRLFSMLPAYYDPDHLSLPHEQPCTTSEIVEVIEKVCNIMTSLKMPFIDTSVIPKLADCPCLTDYNAILKNFFQVNMDKLLTLSLDNESICVLIQYFSKDTKPSDNEWVKHIRSLPFFIDVAGTFQPIHNVESFLWPNCCDAGYNEWTCGTNVTFVRHEKWSSLASAEQLCINEITDADVYTNHIFPKFYLLSESDRFKHLEHIRSHIYPSAKGWTESEFNGDSEQMCTSKRFINALKTVKCIGPNGTTLKPISSFCDHTVEVFITFFTHFKAYHNNYNTKNGLIFSKNLD